MGVINYLLEFQYHATRRQKQLEDEQAIHHRFHNLRFQCPDIVGELLLLRARVNREQFMALKNAGMLRAADVIEQNLDWIDAHHAALLEGIHNGACSGLKNALLQATGRSPTV